MAVVLTFDLVNADSSVYAAVDKALQGLGFYRAWRANNNSVVNLPRNTYINVGIGAALRPSEVASEQLRQAKIAIQGAGGKLDQAFACWATGWAA